MPHPQLDRSKLRIRSLAERPNRVELPRDAVYPDATPAPLSIQTQVLLEECAARMRAARKMGRPNMLAFGAHTIKNGLAPVLIRLMEQGWLSLLATNGAGIIHDWEFAFQGESSEHVGANVEKGQFGIWEETGLYLNLGLAVGAYEGLGYGESIGKMIQQEGLQIPEPDALLATARDQAAQNPALAAAALDLLDVTRARKIPAGFLSIPHPHKQFSVQAAAFRLNVPFTAHPMIGHDIIYTHPANHCAAIGRAAQRDFLAFASQVQQLDGGVYLSIGSAVMSPMIFEKSLSMSQNLELQNDRKITRHFMMIVDLAESTWDWQKEGEPPHDNPAYYMRYCKTFSRMGGTMRYASAGNRDFLLTLEQLLVS